MDWEVIKMSSIIRIKNLPDLANDNLIKEFLSKATTEIESIEIKENYADIILTNEDDLEPVLMLNGHEILGFTVKVQKRTSTDGLSDPEILVDDTFKEDFDDKETFLDFKPLEPPQNTWNNGKIENSLQLRQLLQGISLKQRKDLQGNDVFGIIANTKLVGFITMITLIVLTFSDIFG